jgi:chromate transporter
VLVLLACGFAELARRRFSSRSLAALVAPAGPLAAVRGSAPGPLLAAVGASGGVGALAWTALKVGALSFGGGFVIVPLMQADAVNTYHWMTHSQFLNAVALGQVTPGPLVQTVAVVGYAAFGVPGALLAALVAFTPSFVFVIAGAGHFERLRADGPARRFLAGAGPAAAGAILGASIPLAASISEAWQFAILAAAIPALLLLRTSVVTTLLLAGGVGAVLALLGAPLPA